MPYFFAKAVSIREVLKREVLTYSGMEDVEDTPQKGDTQITEIEAMEQTAEEYLSYRTDFHHKEK